MKLYTPEQTTAFHDHTFAFLEVAQKDHVLWLTLNRTSKKNALHPQMVAEIAYAFHYARFDKSVWMVCIQAKGPVFCAGADLKALAGIVEPHHSTIPAPAGEILFGELFNKIHKPVIAKVTGDVYAGGFFFLAGSHIVLACEGLKFGLPEVKRGLFPMQVMAALLRVMPARKVIDWCIRGYDLPVEAAARYGLITEVVSREKIDERTDTILNELKQNSPTAIRLGLEAFDTIQPATDVHKYLSDMLKKAIHSKDGHEGLTAFREKRRPKWTGE